MVGNALAQRFQRGLRRAPDGVCLTVGTERITYAAAHRTALRWGAAVRATAPDRPIGVLASGTTSYLGILAGLYAGRTVVPLHAGFPPARTRAMLAAAGAGAIITDDRTAAQVRDLAGDVPVLLAGKNLDAAGHAPLADPAAPAGDAAYLLFTSGSTGRPKGVPITHGSLAHYFALLDDRYDFDRHDVFSQTFDLNFDCAMFDLFCAWGAGAEVLRVPPQAYRDLPDFLARNGVSVWFSTPSAIGLVRRLGGLAPSSLPSLRWSFFAGEALRTDDAQAWQLAAPQSAVENLYGPTELTVTVTAHRYGPESGRLGVNGVVPIGALHHGHRMRLTAEDGTEAAEEGELWVSGPQLTPGYLDPADGAGRFARHDGILWYRTGDRVRRLADGELLYLGRLDAQVQLQGWRVELTEIDHAVRGVPGVDDAVTVDATAGDAHELVVFHTGDPVSPAGLSRALRAVLPDRLIPRHYEHRTELPLNSNRKTDRLALRARAAELLAAAQLDRGSVA
ncbi:D-alanine--poly(phosphoribitol) ligase [Micromonospora arborensis]|uniref:D-alanine--poly(Phosphoribitol) ligase n=1 Tax=Micromonospora arborensis TaxID=2116518 RepID=A0A318NE22_9ACTN|nr:AMP-binding protein [Micromonospora arborensis]PYC66957.1 D-alanine--poly(phosphoribitol) ligase [Micromonospora arborensis]